MINAPPQFQVNGKCRGVRIVHLRANMKGYEEEEKEEEDEPHGHVRSKPCEACLLGGRLTI